MVNKQTSEPQRLREILGKKQNNVLSITEILRCIGLSLKVLFTIRCRGLRHVKCLLNYYRSFNRLESLEV